MGFHRVWALVVLALLLVAVAAGVWALGRRAWDVRYALYLRICTGAIGIQALVGIVLVFSGERPRAGLHFLFGPLALFALPVAARIAARRDEGRQRGSVLLGGAVLTFVVALVALLTGGGS